MRLYKHKDYKEYVKNQTTTNVGKLNNVWANNKDIGLLSKHITKNISDIKFGICHGVRNAWEVQQLRRSLKIDVIGTEISYTALQFENTIQWDFHDVKDEWVGSVDFIYSNSLDHSYDPEMCLGKWMSCIKKEGICYIHWSRSSEGLLNSADCFSATSDEYRKMFNTNYMIEDEVCYCKSKIMFAIKHRK